MTATLSRALLALFFLSAMGIVGSAQTGRGVTLAQTVYTTTPKAFVARLNNQGKNISEIEGFLSFTLTDARSDDSILGTLDYTIPDDARQKIAAQTGKRFEEVPDRLSRKSVVDYFEKGAAPPIIHLLIEPMEMEVAGAKVNFDKITLDIKAREGGARYSPEEIEALITVWARQIQVGRSRRGIILALNGRIAGER
jgi:hypothetical protein